MRTGRRGGRLAAAAVTLVMAARAADAADPGTAGPALPPDPAHVAAASRMMTDLQAESARHAAAIRDGLLQVHLPQGSELGLADVRLGDCRRDCRPPRLRPIERD